MVVCASMTTLTMSLRGKSGARDVAIHCMQWARTGNAVRSPTHSGSPRAFALEMTRCVLMKGALHPWDHRMDEIF
jgi:hypothetical protein